MVKKGFKYFIGYKDGDKINRLDIMVKLSMKYNGVMVKLSIMVKLSMCHFN